MQSIVLKDWKHAINEFGHELEDIWRWVRGKAKRLWPITRNRVDGYDPALSARKRYGLEKMIWRGGPHFAVSDNGNEVTVFAEMPGLDRDDFSIEVDDRFLNIRAERKASREERRKGLYYSETSYGLFSRTIPLPCEVDGAKASAKYNDGQLRIVLPREGADRGRLIEISI